MFSFLESVQILEWKIMIYDMHRLQSTGLNGHAMMSCACVTLFTVHDSIQPMGSRALVVMPRRGGRARHSRQDSDAAEPAAVAAADAVSKDLSSGQPKSVPASSERPNQGIVPPSAAAAYEPFELSNLLRAVPIRRAHLLVERALTPVVQRVMQAHYGDGLAFQQRTAELETAAQQQQEEEKKLRQEIELLEGQAAEPNQKQRLAQLKKKLYKLEKEQQKPLKAAPKPLWLQKCHEVCGVATALYLTQDKPTWDVFKLVQILAGFLKEVFAPALGLQSDEARYLLQHMLEVQTARNQRAHGQAPTGDEVLDGLRCLLEVLRKVSPGANQEQQELKQLLKWTQERVQEARDQGGQVQQVEVPGGEQDRASLVLYCALVDFEARLRSDSYTGGFAYGGHSIGFGTKVNTWDQQRQARVKAMSESTGQPNLLQRVAAARNVLFHSDMSGEVTALLEPTLQDMGEVLRRTWWILSNQPEMEASLEPPEGWAKHRQRWEHIKSNNQVEVKMELPPPRMKIPVPRVQWPGEDELADGKRQGLVGRQDELELAVEAVRRPGARVVIWGSPGTGKDALAMEVVSHPRVTEQRLCPQNWLQGTTEELLHTELVQDARDERKRQVEAALDWLQSNGDWLLVVEDATDKSLPLLNQLAASDSKGRLLVTCIQKLELRSEALTSVHLEALDFEQCCEFWRRMKVFTSNFRPPPLGQDLKAQCDQTGNEVVYQADDALWENDNGDDKDCLQPLQAQLAAASSDKKCAS
eukprot:g23312.t1